MLSLASIGYRDGVSFSGLEGRQELFFRVPHGSWFTVTRLILPFDAVAATPVARTLTIMARDRVLGQVAIGANGMIDLPVPRDAIAGGTLHLTLIYSGGATPNRCFDRRTAADHLRLDPAGGLALDIVPGATMPAGAAAALIGTAPSVVLPARINAAQAAAALTVIAARGGGALVTTTPPAPARYIRIGNVGDPELSATSNGNMIALTIGGRDPATTARAIFSRVGDTLAAPKIDHLAITPNIPDTLTFADLGADLSPTSIAGEGGWALAVPASRLPIGKTIVGLSIDVAALSTDPSDSVSAWLNDTLLGSAPLDRSGRTRLNVDAPDGLMHSLNGIAVRITRGRRDDCGDIPRGWPAQLLGSSMVRLGGAGPVRDFHDFAAASHAGVTVVLPGPDALPLAAKAVAGLLDGRVPITVSWRQMPAAGPVILIADTPPPGATAPLVMLGGRLTLTGASSEVAFDLPDSHDATIVQLVQADGRPILWIRPARTGPPATMWLDQGDVALVADDGTVTPISSTRPRLAIATAVNAPSWWQQNQRLLLILAAVLAVSLITAWSFRPSVRKSKPGQDAA
ncbi:cellulose biosynthesis cyclic di-GMP-binding regulatory protein BcsB [Sphingomonas sp. So64.6b]|uniref:hypothetical protein n=1 Tax=Sphingomonas sp. So64.6b TaxID=2997354 RepID=UPI001602A738|nr:hypothetical protein [Sphingomonas sp. So64.6b]QNA83291.1 cellulose biosynthesis cyclic di-GMP-binding regulatory protein BcsB [Sphingomonas sp. So64.6b]